MNNQDTVRSKAVEFFNKAEQFRSEKKLPEALQEYYRVILRAPQHWPAYYYIGTIMSEQEQKHAALIAFQRAAEFAPSNPGVLVSLGAALKTVGRRDEAKDSFKKAIELEPENIHAIFNLGELLLRMNEPEQAIERFDQVLSGDKDADNIKALSQWLRAVSRLTLGDYQNAWEDYESRINHPTTWFPSIPGAKWLGQSLEDKRILLAYEQRFGDVIQFARFVHRLNKLGAHVLLQAPPQLMRQFSYLDGDVEIVNTNDPLPEYDYYQLITSIPALLNLSMDEIETEPYLRIDEAEKTNQFPLRMGTKLKVGLVWSGKPKPDRSIPFSYYLPLLQNHEVSFFSFQLGPTKEDLNKYAVNWLVHDLSPQINDFYDSSVLMKEMDLIITIDTAAAHQAGALGIPTWLMLISYSDWRWGSVKSDSTQWYPSMRIFRQAQYESWDEAANELYTAFDEWVSLPR